MKAIKDILINSTTKDLYKLFDEFESFCLNNGINTSFEALRLFKEIYIKKNNENFKEWETKQLKF